MNGIWFPTRFTRLAALVASLVVMSCGSEGGSGTGASGSGAAGPDGADKPGIDCETLAFPAGPLKGRVLGAPWEAKDGLVTLIPSGGAEVYNFYVLSATYAAPCSTTFKEGVELGIFLDGGKPGTFEKDKIASADISASGTDPEHEEDKPKARVELTGEPTEGGKLKAKVAICYGDKNHSWVGGEIEVRYCGKPTLPPPPGL